MNLNGALMEDAKDGSLIISKVALKKGTDINAKDKFDCIDVDKRKRRYKNRIVSPKVRGKV